MADHALTSKRDLHYYLVHTNPGRDLYLIY